MSESHSTRLWDFGYVRHYLKGAELWGISNVAFVKRQRILVPKTHGSLASVMT